MNELTPRGTTLCRGCGESSLEHVLDLGAQPLANEMSLYQAVPDPTFPLHLRVCTLCGLGQIGEYVLPERIFGAEYPYLSSVSTTWLEHTGRYVSEMQNELDLGPDTLVVEIASNDGYLLRQVMDRGIPVVGVEPAEGVARLARNKGVRTISEFFGRAMAEQLVTDHGHPRLVVVNNVMAHVPDLADFVSGLEKLCDEATVITVENPSFLTLLLETHFDTIYHEHFSYLTAHAVSHTVGMFGLELVRVDQLETHGGSNRYWITRRGARDVDSSVPRLIARELAAGLLSPRVWQEFEDRSRSAIAGLRRWLDDRMAASHVVGAYGAAAKGNTLMNAAGVDSTEIAFVADGSLAKQGKFLPGSHIPVVAPEELDGQPVDDVLLLPWNIAHELAPLVASHLPAATPWVAIPEMQPLR